MPEIIACPSCSKKLQIPEAFFGKTVQCPECKHSFKAEGASPAGGAGAVPPPPPGPPPISTKEDRESIRNDDRPSRRDDDYDRPRRKRTQDDDYDDDDDYDRPRRRRRYQAPHRGGAVLALGIIGFFCVITGIIAWVMGNNDLAEMRAGRMDREGEGITQAGRICGMISTILAIVGTVGYCLLIAMMVGAGGGRRF